MAGTEAVTADITFEDQYELTLGGVTLQLVHTAQAHTTGDIFVWLREPPVVFTGDIVFSERMLGVLPVSSSAGWIKSFEAMAALEPRHVVLGHGKPTDLKTAKAFTYDYLVHLRKVMGAYMEKGGDEIGSVNVDQSAFSSILLFDGLAKRNAQAVFAEMEFE